MRLEEVGEVEPLALRRLVLGLLVERGPLVNGAGRGAPQELVLLLAHLGCLRCSLGLRAGKLALKEHAEVVGFGELLPRRLGVGSGGLSLGDSIVSGGRRLGDGLVGCGLSLKRALLGCSCSLVCLQLSLHRHLRPRLRRLRPDLSLAELRA